MNVAVYIVLYCGTTKLTEAYETVCLNRKKYIQLGVCMAKR